MLIIAAVLSAAQICAAQNNPYKINDKLYKLYLDYYPQRTTEKGLEMGNELYRQAVAMGDRKAQCIALTIPLNYYYLKDNQKAFERSLKTMQDKAIEYGYLQYYYYGVLSKTNFLIRDGKELEAYHYVVGMEKFARKHDHKYGVFTALNSIGLIQVHRREFGIAANTFQEALQIGTTYLQGQDMAPVYRKISGCYEELYRYDLMLSYALKGYAVSKTPMSRQRILRYVAYAEYMLGNYEEFKKYADLYFKLRGSMPDVESNDFESCEMAILLALYNRDYATAEKYLNKVKVTDNIYKMRLWVNYHYSKGNFEKVASLQKHAYHERIVIQDSVRSQSLAEINASLFNQKMMYEKQRLEIERQALVGEHQREALRHSHLQLANTELTLHNSSLELNRARSAADILKMSAANKQLEAAKLRGELQAAKSQKHFRDTIAVSAVGLGAFLIIGTIVWLWTHRRLMRRLNKVNDELARNNRELVQAKESAETADRVKTVFIQKMGDNLRDPLNTVKRLSNLIANGASTMTKDECRTYTNSIHSSTEKLLSLVGDVLDTAQLESGIYCPKFEQTTVGDVIDSAIDAVAASVRDGVAIVKDIKLPENHMFTTDVRRVRQVLVNMLENSLRYTERGRVTVGCSLSMGELTFSVADTGTGISAEKAVEIFGQSQSIDRLKHGEGIGMHVSRIIARMLGGAVWLDRSYSNGARFFFSIRECPANTGNAGLDTKQTPISREQ